MMLKILGTIDLIAIIAILFTNLWIPIKIILIMKFLYTGILSWSNIFNE